MHQFRLIVNNMPHPDDSTLKSRPLSATPGGTPPLSPAAYTPRQHLGNPSYLGNSVSLLSADSSLNRAALEASRNNLCGVLSTGNSPLSQGAVASRSHSFLSSPDPSENGSPARIATFASPKGHRPVAPRHARTASLPSQCSTDGVCSVSRASSTPFPVKNQSFLAPLPLRAAIDSDVGPPNISFCTVSAYANTHSGSEASEADGGGVAAALDRALLLGIANCHLLSANPSQQVSKTTSARGEAHQDSATVATPSSSSTLHVNSTEGTPNLPKQQSDATNAPTHYQLGETVPPLAFAATQIHATPERRVTPVRALLEGDGRRPPRPHAQSRTSHSRFDPFEETANFPLTRSRSSPISIGNPSRLQRGFYPMEGIAEIPTRNDSADELSGESPGQARLQQFPERSVTTPTFGTPPGSYPNSTFLSEMGRVPNYSIVTTAAHPSRRSFRSFTATPLRRSVSPADGLGGSARMEWDTPGPQVSDRSTPMSTSISVQQQSTPVVANRTFAAVLPPPVQHGQMPNYPPGGELLSVLSVAREALSRRRASTKATRVGGGHQPTAEESEEAIQKELDGLRAREAELNSKLAQIKSRSPSPPPPPKQQRVLLELVSLILSILLRVMRSVVTSCRPLKGSLIPINADGAQRCLHALSNWLTECEH